MKKRILILLAALLCLGCLVALTACDEGGTPEGGTPEVEAPPEHTHNWGEWDVTTVATCVSKGTETRTCACGESETREVAVDDAAHAFATNVTSDATHHWYACTRVGCNATQNKTAHIFATTWENDDVYHWHECTGCGVKNEVALHQSSGAPTASSDETCTVCDCVIAPATGIRFKTLTVNGTSVYGEVSNNTLQFSFINEVEMVGEAKYAVLMNVSDNTPVLSKTIDLAIGNNTVYIVELVDDDPTNIYTVVLRRRPMHTVTFDPNGGTTVPSQTVEEGAFVNGSSAPTKSGYTFVGWSTSSAATQSNVEFPYQLNHSTTFYAVYRPNTYTVTYDPNGGSIAEGNTQTVTFDAAYTLREPERTGYRFVGYTMNGKTFTKGKTYTYSNGITLVAQWEAITYTITYNQNGATTSAINPTSYTILTDTITLTNPKKTGYIFSGWYTAETGGERVTKIVKGSTGNIKLYARYDTDTYTITYHQESATTKAENPTTYSVTTDTIILAAPERTGYTFVGWFTTAEGEGQVTRIAKGSTGNKVLYACFAPNTYTITYDPNGGEMTETEPQSVTFDAAFTLREPTRTGYRFVGYTLNGEAFTKGATYTYPNGITLVAQWEIITYTVTYNQSGATTPAVNPTSYTIQTNTITLTNPKKTGYTFSGWYTAAEGGERVTRIVKGSTGNKTLYARFTANTYTITYSPNGGSISAGNTQTVTFDASYALREPTREGYRFVGYTLNGEAFTKGDTYTYPNGITLVAQWEVYKCEISYYNDSLQLIETKTVYYGETLSDAYAYWYYDGNAYYEGGKAFKREANVQTLKLYGSATSLSGLNFKISNSKATITGYTGNSTALVISPFVMSGDQAYPVTGIGASAFEDCNSLTTVEFGANSQLTSIGDSAFHNCSSLTSITIPASVKSIGNYAFRGCGSLESIIVASGNPVYHSTGNCLIKTASKTLIAGCKNSVIPTDGSVTSIGVSAFSGCSSLTSITIPNSVTGIGASAFEDCSSLASITIPFVGATPTATGYQAHFGYIFGYSSGSSSSSGYHYYDSSSKYYTYYIPSSLKTVVITGVTGIGERAFYNCDSLTTITIPASVTSIGSYAFSSCDSLTTVEFGANSQLTSIGYKAFYSCDSLTSITIPVSVTSIGNDAFEACYKLIEVYNLSTLNITAGSDDYGYVGAYAKNVYTSATASSKQFTDSNGYLFYDDGTNRYLLGYTGTDTALTLPASCKGNNYEIYKYAFRIRDDITSVTIPASVTRIGDYAFYDCDSLTTVEFGANSQLTRIGNYAFQDCARLTSITIPASVTSIGSSAFQDCARLTSITIPASVTSIGGSAFSSCDNLTTVEFGANSQLTSIGWYAFRECSSLTTVEFGANSKLTSINSYAFSGCSSLTSITIPARVTSIGDVAFYNCSNLTSITIPKGVTSIGNYAFAHCRILKSINYRGTATQWSAISKGTDWNLDAGIFTVYCNYTGK